MKTVSIKELQESSVESLKADLQQEAIALEINGEMYFI